MVQLKLGKFDQEGVLRTETIWVALLKGLVWWGTASDSEESVHREAQDKNRQAMFLEKEPLCLTSPKNWSPRLKSI